MPRNRPRYPCYPQAETEAPAPPYGYKERTRERLMADGTTPALDAEISGIAAQHRGGAGASRRAPRQQRRLRPDRRHRSGGALLRPGPRPHLRGRRRAHPPQRARHPGHHQGVLRGGHRAPRARRPRLPRPPRRRRDLALRRQGLRPAGLRPRDPARADPDRPGHLPEGHPHGGRQRGARTRSSRPNRRSTSSANRARSTAASRPSAAPSSTRSASPTPPTSATAASPASRPGSSTSTSASAACTRRTC